MTKKSIFFLFLLMVGLQTHAQKTMYNIKDFGAVGNGETLCTNAINSAITKCTENGGGIVLIPVGIFKSGTILMKNNVELHLEMGATLLASGDQKDFPRQPQPAFQTHLDVEGWHALIYAEGVSNIAITGLGTINGDGALQKGIQGIERRHYDEMFGRPRNILFVSCKQIRVEGIKLLQAASWMQHYLDCEDVIIDRVEVYNHCNRNNDAIDIDGCRRFVLSNSILDSDDDCITMKSSGAAATEDVTITNCVVSSTCNAIKTGTGSTGGFRNISISNCVIKPTLCKTPPVFNTPIHGISGISLEIVDGGTIEVVSISNITIEGTACPLFIRLGNRARKHTDSAPEPPVGKIRNVTISNIVAYNTGNLCSSITAIPGYYVENVTIDNIQLFNTGGVTDGQFVATHQEVVEHEQRYPEANQWGNLPSSVFFIRHVKGLSISNLMFGSKEPDPRIPVIAVDVERFRLYKSVYSGISTPPCFILLDRVKEFDIDKPLGWGNIPVIKQ
jgi:polygalacturonase